MVLYILTGILALAAAVSVFRLYQYKRQIESFTHAVQKRKDTDWNKPVTVDYFDKDITDLAEALNSCTDMCRNLAGQYENDKNQLKNVIAGISHDFRTPLTAAKGYLQLLIKSEKLEGREEEYLKTAMDKVTYLKLLSDDFFEISSMDAKGKTAETAYLNVANFLSECILQQYGWIEEQGLRTDFQLPESDIFVETNKRFYRDGARSKEGSGLGLYIVACLSKRLEIKTGAECRGGVFLIWMRFPQGG